MLCVKKSLVQFPASPTDVSQIEDGVNIKETGELVDELQVRIDNTDLDGPVV